MSCSEAERASRASRTCCALQSASGTAKATENSGPGRHRAGDHRRPGERAFGAGTADAPLQATPPHQLAPVLALEQVAARREHHEMRNTTLAHQQKAATLSRRDRSTAVCMSFAAAGSSLAASA